MSPKKETAAARRKRERERSKQDDTLFAHLGALHRLEEDDLDLLTAVASKAGFARKCDIFVRPSAIEGSPDPERWPLARAKKLRAIIEGPPPAPRSSTEGSRR